MSMSSDALEDRNYIWKCYLSLASVDLLENQPNTLEQLAIKDF